MSSWNDDTGLGFSQTIFTLKSPEENKNKGVRKYNDNLGLNKAAILNDKNKIYNNRNNYYRNNNRYNSSSKKPGDNMPKFQSSPFQSRIVPTTQVPKNSCKVSIKPGFTMTNKINEYNNYDNNNNNNNNRNINNNKESNYQLIKKKSKTLLDIGTVFNDNSASVSIQDEATNLEHIIKTPVVKVTNPPHSSSGSKGERQLKSIPDSGNKNGPVTSFKVYSDGDNRSSSRSSISNNNNNSNNFMKRGNQQIEQVKRKKFEPQQRKPLEFQNSKNISSSGFDNAVNNPSVKRKNPVEAIDLLPTKRNIRNKNHIVTEVIDLLGDSSEEEDVESNNVNNVTEVIDSGNALSD
jgi:hypothetical protein